MAPYRCWAACGEVPRIAPMRFQGMPLARAEVTASAICCSPRARARTARSSRGSWYNPCSAAYVPPPPEHLEPLVDDLVDYVNGTQHPPLLQAAVVHAQFETTKR